MTTASNAEPTGAQPSRDVFEYDPVYWASSSHLSAGKLRLAPGGLGFKHQESGEVVTLPAAEMRRVNWMRVGKEFGLRFSCEGGAVIRLDGFPADTFDELKSVMKKYYDLELEVKELSLRGWNWGQTDVQGQSLIFNVGKQQMLEIPLSEISNVSMPTKQEVSLEFRLDPQQRKTDSMVEMRWMIPGKNEDQDEAQILFEKIKTKMDVDELVAGEAIAELKELPFVTPRGRYDVDVFSDCLRMHGKSYDYKILFSSIKYLFMVPKTDDVHTYFVIALDPPIRQGQTRYPYLVLQFLRDEEMELSLNMDEAELNEKYEGKLQKNYDSLTSEVVSNILTVMTKQSLIKHSAFKSHFTQPGVKCSMKANDGTLYPLEDSFLFLPKPPMHMPYSDISQVTFSRISGARSFDLTITMRKGQEYSFSSVDKEEMPLLELFLAKRVRVKQEAEPQVQYNDTESSESDDDDTRPRKRSAAGQPAATGGDDDDDDESEDEDFVADEDSDVAEEYDENYDSSGDGSSDAGEEGGDDNDE